MKEANVRVQIKTKVNAPADAVWDILGKQFSNIYKWTTVVEASREISIDEIPPSKFVPARSICRTQSINKIIDCK